jgi:hypothetical protein
MMFRNLIVVTFLVAAARSNGETCSVCGDKWVVGAPDALVSFPGQFSISCEQLQVAGMSGLIPLHQCEMFRPLLLDVCSCQELMVDVIQEEGQDVKLRRMMGPKRRLEEWSPAMAPTDNSRSSPVDSAEGEIVTSEYPGKLRMWTFDCIQNPKGNQRLAGHVFIFSRSLWPGR